MDLSMKWLKDFVKADMPIKEFSDGMTMSGSKVESFSSLSDPIKNIVVAKVLKLERHPDSEKLWICQLDTGADQPTQIVTAAQNLFEGAIVPACLHNSILADGTKITKGKLRGVASNGMMCSYQELGLTPQDFAYPVPEDGILILNEDPDVETFEMGMDICKALGLDDTVVEFEITNNRPDCLSVLGLAKEASATFGIPFNYTKPTFKGIEGDINKELSVVVENTDLCSRYMAAVVKNVKIGPSPRWLSQRLRASGVRPINNYVDITNFVMLEYGHPMHAFDKRYVEDNKIVIRNAEEGETLILLDDMAEPVKLSPEMLIIADGKKPVGIAGVMGGKYSGIMEDTKEVVFEAACFDGVSVRRTAKKVGERTEASSRFEKGLDPRNAEEALMRALQLVEMLGCGEVVKTIIDADYHKNQPVKLKHDYKWVNKALGADIPEDEQIKILKSLGYEYDFDKGEITVPSTRIDMVLPCDVAEEVARIYGYNNIPSTIPLLQSQGKITDQQAFEKKVVDVALSQGCFETMTFSFISPRDYDKLQMDEDKKNSVVITNPLGEDTSVMRTSSLTSMMEVVERNYKNRNLAARFFEIAREYYPKENSLPVEKDTLCLGVYGAGEDFYSVKGICEEIFDTLNINAKYVPVTTNSTFHPGRCAEIIADGKIIGVVGEIHPQVCDNFGVNLRVYSAVLKMDKMLLVSKGEKKYKQLPKFPATSRDLSLVCDENVNSGDIIEIIQKSGKYLEQIMFFDMYKGEQVQEGKKSLSYKLVLRKKDGTITDEEADSSVNKVLKALEQKEITLRK